MISKSECMSTLVDNKDVSDYKTFCDVIDEYLKKSFDGSLPIGISIPDGINRKVVNLIIKEYSNTKLGWKVERGNDQIDGSWLTFS